MAGKWGLGPDTPPAGDTSDAAIAAAIAAGKQQQSAQGPIGVPFYITDPATGQPQMGPDGQPLRWGAQVQTGKPAVGTWGIVQNATDYVLPRYFDGAQWLPAQLPPDVMAQLQKKMVAAGLLKPGEAQLGIWDTNSMQAYTKLLAYANASGLDYQTALDNWGAAHTATGDQGTPHAPLVTKLTNPDDLKMVFRKNIIDTLGQGWSSDKIDGMVADFQQKEREASQQEYAMTGYGSTTEPGPGGELTKAPDPTAYAVTQARQQDPGLAQEHDELGMLNQFRQTLGTWNKIQ